MMAQRVEHSYLPVTIIFIFAVFHFAKSSMLASTDTLAIANTEINSVKLVNARFASSDSSFHVDVDGREIGDELELRWSSSSDECLAKNALQKVWTAPNGARATYEFSDNSVFKVNTTIYFCYRAEPRAPWLTLGKNISIKPVWNRKNARSRRQNPWESDAPETVMQTQKLFIDISLEGLRIEYAYKNPELEPDGIPMIIAGRLATIRLFGNITNNTLIAFTDAPLKKGSVCNQIRSSEYPVRNVGERTALIDVVLPKATPFYVCTKRNFSINRNTTEDIYRHQGTASQLAIHTYYKLLPVWLTIVVILTCLSFSALFSGLNLGLMAMDRTELKILCNTGTEKEQMYARKIQPVRNHGNYLLCSILFSNVLVNSIFTILLDDLTSGLFAVCFSTLAIVIVGEITPQAICSRHGLCIGAKTIFVTKISMALTCFLSYPMSKILDFCLGEEIGNVYNRERLKELVRVTNEYNDLEKDEVNIIAGALEMRRKTVANVMTRIEDVFMLDYNAVLDFETVSEIMKSGYSRIPVFEGTRTNIMTMLYIKDLAFIDPDDNTPLKTLCQFYQNPCNFVFEDVTLDVMFTQFKEGHKGHMAFVQRVNNEGEGDPFYEVIGLVTLEDVIEELIQAEIIDETDVFIDNRTKRKRLARPKMPDFSMFAEKKENQSIHISPQLTLAMFQYLSTTVEAFKPPVISETILRRLLKQDIIYHIKVKSRDKAKNDPATIIYQQGKAVDYFVLILEGRVQVTVGRENLLFEGGPFTYFGTQALTVNNIGMAESPTNANPQTMGSIQSVNLDVILRHTFVPDFTVRAVTEIFYCKIKRSLYLAAKRATLLEMSQKDPSSRSQDQFDDEVEKLLHSLDEDDRSVPESPVLPKDNEDVRERDKDKETENDAQTTVLNSPPLGNSTSPIKSNFAPFVNAHNGTQKNSPIKVPATYGALEGQFKSDQDVENSSNCQLEAALLLPNRSSFDKEEERPILSSRKSDS